MKKYNQPQQIFALNWLSNILANVKGDSSNFNSEATTAIDKVLGDSTDLMGNWNRVWGPVVFSAKPSTTAGVADNTMFLAKSADPGINTYVLAIAGTNPISPYGWLVEDFKTDSTQTWPFLEAKNDPSSDIKISTGTYLGIQHLLQMEYNSQNIIDFLSSKSSDVAKQTEVIVTGHSLGGALSAALALALKDSQTKDSTMNVLNVKGEVEGTLAVNKWDESLNCIVSCMPSAGATPGNEAFANYFDQELGARTIRLWNNLDVVPHAWQTSMLDEITKLYEPGIKSNALIKLAVAKAKNQAAKSGETYLQIMEQIPGFPGVFNSEINNASGIANLIKKIGAARAEKIIESILMDISKDGGLITKIILPEKFVEKYGKVIAEMIVYMLENGADAKFEKWWKKFENEHPLYAKGLSIFMTEVNTFFLFLVQLGYQHVNAYVEVFMEISEFNTLMQKYKPQPTSKEALV